MTLLPTAMLLLMGQIGGVVVPTTKQNTPVQGPAVRKDENPEPRPLGSGTPISGFEIDPVMLSTRLPATGQSRFQSAYPLVDLPAIKIDRFLDVLGATKDIARRNNLQGRIMWIDCTANIDRYNEEGKIVDLVARIKKAGFNTIVLDVKPISGQVIYPSKHAPKLREWRGKNLPEEFDPVRIFERECKREGMPIYAAMNAFSDGHRLFNAGPGFERLDEVSVVYESDAQVKSGLLTINMGAKPTYDTVGVVSVGTNTKAPVSFPVAGNVVVMKPTGEVVQYLEDAGSANPTELVVPKNGFLLSGIGRSAEWLKRNAQVGTKLETAATARFVKLNESTDKQYPLMTSPTNPYVRRRLFQIGEEFISNYEFNGIIFDDRLRYTGLNGDFSDITRDLFERHVGKKLNWPDDVFRFTYSFSLNKGVQPGPYYEDWLSWRANVITTFISQFRSHIQKFRPTAQLGVYAGSWFGEYQSYGNNWGSDDFDAGFWFLTRNYAATGMADELDFLVTGCYYPTATVYDAMAQGKPIGPTVEAAGYLSYRAVNDKTWSYAGIALDQFKDDPVGLGNALQAAVASTNGVMVFDLSHDIEPMWGVFEKAFSQAMVAPHTRPDLLTEARRRNKNKSLYPKPPVIISAGSSGVGF